MKCPVCHDADLLMAERQGVEVDYCPDCRGVWLDRGKLDRIVERGGAGDSRAQTSSAGVSGQGSSDDPRYSQKKQKKSSLFGDILGGLGG